MSSINVTNNSGNTIEVAVNHWGTGGNVSFYRIGDKKKDSWSRQDGRGFIMVITKHNDDRRNGAYYFVKEGANITVTDVHGGVSGALNKLTNPY
jgi:hypothetical protein